MRLNRMLRKKLSPSALNFLWNLLAFLPYLFYIGFVVAVDQGPIDYETFMSIGSRVLAGGPVYGVNSYYPMPYALVFALFRLIPRPLSMMLWLGLPVLAAWLIMGRKPWVLLFAPLFGHFVGGQSAVFALIGLWGYRRARELTRLEGGFWLGLISIKPQLVVFPLLFAGREWLVYLWRERRIPRQALAWLGSMGIWYLVGVPFGFDWVLQWLSNMRPVFYRPQAGILPRTLIMLGMDAHSPLFWGCVIVGALVVMTAAWLYNRRHLSFDLWMFLAACFFPLIHDYDLIQLIPLIDTPLKRRWALIASIPLWLVILFAYQIDEAWYVVTLIPPVLAWVTLVEERKKAAAELKQNFPAAA